MRKQVDAIENFLQGACDGTIRSFFREYGFRVIRQPMAFLIFSIIVVVLALSGLPKIKPTQDLLANWTPYGSKTLEDRDYVHSHFGLSPRTMALIASKGSQTAENILTDAALTEMMALHQKIAAISIGYGGATATYTDVCIRSLVTNDCSIDSILAVWDFNTATLAADADKLATLTAAIAAEPALDALLSGKTMAGGVITGASAVASNHPIAATDVDLAELIEEEFLDLAKAAASATVYYERYADRAFNDEAMVTYLIVGLVFLSSISVLVFVCLTLGKLGTLVYSRIRLAALGVLGVAVSILCAFGVAGWFGWLWDDIDITIPFLIYGIGLDDMYIFVNEYGLYDSTRARHRESAVAGAHSKKTGAWSSIGKRAGFDPIRRALFKNRFVSAMSRAGPTSSMTSATDLVAFLIGCSSTLPAMRYYCVKCLVAVAFVYFLQWTWFCVLTWYDNLRILRGARDLPLPCVAQKREKLDLMQREVMDAFRTKRLRKLADAGFLRVGLTRFVSKIAFNNAARLVILLLLGGFLAYSATGITDLRRGIATEDLVVDGSFVTKYDNADMHYFPNGAIQPPIRMVVRFDRLPAKDLPPVYDLVTQKKLEALYDSLNTNAEFGALEGQFFLPELFAFMQASATYSATLLEGKYAKDRDQFYEALFDFLSHDQYKHYAADLSFVESVPSKENADLTAVSMSKPPGPWADAKIDMLKAAQSIVDDYKVSLDVFEYSIRFAELDNELVISGEAWTLLLSSILVSFAVTYIFLATTSGSLLIMLAITSVDLCVFGIMRILDLKLNAVTVSTMVVGIGFSVDYCAHIVHGTIHHKVVSSGLGGGVGGTGSGVSEHGRRGRVLDALFACGSSVLNGGISTLFAVGLLIFADMYYVRVFGIMYVSYIVVGLLHGMIILPILLSLVGPRSGQGHALHGSEPGKDTKMEKVKLKGETVEASDDAEEESKTGDNGEAEEELEEAGGLQNGVEGLLVVENPVVQADSE